MRWVIGAFFAMLVSACATASAPSSIGSISLERTPCFGFCPSYSVSIAADGAVTYNGQRFVRVTGEQHGQADPAALAALRQHILAADFFNLQDQYRARVTDLPSARVTVERDGASKSVLDYGGEMVGMPHAVREIQQEIDRVAGTAQWVERRAGDPPMSR
jgi:hypothetical protein